MARRGPLAGGATCAVCGRGALPGERPCRFADGRGGEHIVCPLCVRRALSRGWTRLGTGTGVA